MNKRLSLWYISDESCVIEYVLNCRSWPVNDVFIFAEPFEYQPAGVDRAWQALSQRQKILVAPQSLNGNATALEMLETRFGLHCELLDLFAEF
jgi:hypothetical protein